MPPAEARVAGVTMSSREAVSVVCIDDHIVGAGGVEGTVVL